MNYFLNLELPLWWFFLPLVIAGLLASNLYRVQRIFSKIKANYQLQLREAQNRLDEALNSEAANIERLVSAHREKLNKLKHDAAEREALIISLNKQITEQAERLAKHDELAKKHSVNMSQKVKEIESLAWELSDCDQAIKRLKSKLQLSELAHNEAKADLEGLEQQFAEALAVINRTKRATKQWDKIMKDKAVNVVNTVIEAVKQKQAESFAHDSLGVPTITQADQSENFNARHIKDLGSEVVRGIQEQNEVIKKELQQVDMSTLEAGDSIKLRNNETKDIIDTFNSGGLGYPYGISIQKGISTTNLFYAKNGNYDCTPHELDIVQIIKRPQFDPQVGEKVGIVDSSREFTVVEVGKNKNGYVLRCKGMMHQYKPIQDITPLPNHTYKNGFVCTE